MLNIRIATLGLVVGISSFVCPALADGYKTVKVPDIEMDPDKYLNMSIEIRDLFCIRYKSVGYRCAHVPETTLIDIKSIMPDSMNKYMESNCGKIENLISQKCLFKAKFKLDDVRSDIVDNKKRIWLYTDEANLSIAFVKP